MDAATVGSARAYLAQTHTAEVIDLQVVVRICGVHDPALPTHNSYRYRMRKLEHSDTLAREPRTQNLNQTL